jgi:hypothetical protein
MPTALHKLHDGTHQLDMVNRVLVNWKRNGHESKDFAAKLQQAIEECDKLKAGKIKAIWEVKAQHNEWQDPLLNGFRTWLAKHYASGAVKKEMQDWRATGDGTERKKLMDAIVYSVRTILPAWYKQNHENDSLVYLETDITCFLAEISRSNAGIISSTAQTGSTATPEWILDSISVSFEPETAAPTAPGNSYSFAPSASGPSNAR